jgi:hypothetical protein
MIEQKQEGIERFLARVFRNEWLFCLGMGAVGGAITTGIIIAIDVLLKGMR